MLSSFISDFPSLIGSFVLRHPSKADLLNGMTTTAQGLIKSKAYQLLASHLSELSTELPDLNIRWELLIELQAKQQKTLVQIQKQLAEGSDGVDHLNARFQTIKAELRELAVKKSFYLTALNAILDREEAPASRFLLERLLHYWQREREEPMVYASIIDHLADKEATDLICKIKDKLLGVLPADCHSEVEDRFKAYLIEHHCAYLFAPGGFATCYAEAGNSASANTSVSV